ncbi:transcriptional repressor [bacterium]|nr:transcriptional repressor [bacterium]
MGDTGYKAGPLVPDVAEELLRASGVRMTPQRRAVLAVLEGNTSHPTAAEIVEAVRARIGLVSVATIYNTLETLADLGLVRRLDVMEASTHFDPNTLPHHHFVCRECHAVLDAPPGFGARIAGFGGHTIEDVIFKGTCAKCGPGINQKKRKC